MAQGLQDGSWAQEGSGAAGGSAPGQAAPCGCLQGTRAAGRASGQQPRQGVPAPGWLTLPAPRPGGTGQVGEGFSETSVLPGFS